MSATEETLKRTISRLVNELKVKDISLFLTEEFHSLSREAKMLAVIAIMEQVLDGNTKPLPPLNDTPTWRRNPTTGLVEVL